MKKRDLKHLGRRELVEIIFKMKKRELEFEERIAELEQQLADRNIRMEQAGSIAEAALAVSGIFEAAQAAADAYLLSIGAASEGEAEEDVVIEELEVSFKEQDEEN